MKRIVLFIFLLTFSFQFLAINFSYAQTKGGSSVNVNARVGDFNLSISGYASPYASIVVTVNGVFVRSTTATSDGTFSFSAVPIQSSITSFCIKAVDFKRIGESEACVTTSPVDRDLVFKDLLLPPTIGVSKRTLAAGQAFEVYGYSMPGANVALAIDVLKNLSLKTDSEGKYITTINDLEEGSYRLAARGTYNNLSSLEPKTSILVEITSVVGRIPKQTVQLLEKLIQLVPRESGWILLLIFLLTTLFLLILFYWRRRKDKKKEKK